MKIAATESFEIKKRGGTTKYLEILKTVEQLKPGQSFPVEVPKGVHPGTYRNRIGVKIRFYQPKIAAGCYVSCAVSADEKSVIVSCVKGVKPPSKAGRPKGSKNKPKAKKAVKKAKK